MMWVLCGAARAQEAPAAQVPVAPTVPTVRQQVTVTATRSSVPVGETGKTVYSLGAKELHEYPAVTLDEALRQHAGFELFRRSSTRVQNPTSAGISLRGLGSTAASRTLVLEDGAPLNDPFGGWVHWNENPAQAVEAVTLVSGGGSDLYGSSALGGVIDVVPEGAEATRVEASAVGGSQYTEDLSGLVANSGKRMGELLAGEVLRTAGYIQTDPASAGTVDVPSNVHSETFRTEVGRRLVGDPKVFLTANVLNEARGNGTPLQTNGTRLWRYLAGYETPGDGRVSGRFRAFGSDEGFRQTFSSIAANRDSETLTRLARTRTQELGGTGDATVRLGPAAMVFGADVRDIRGSDDETPIKLGVASGLTDVTARQRYIGGFGEVLGAKGHWSGAASVRVDSASNFDVVQTAEAGSGPVTATLPGNRTEVVASPRVGVVRSFDKGFSLHATGFRAFRAPTMNELYRTGQVGQEITLPNAGLNSERATGWEVGAETTKLPGGNSLQATYFWTEINRPVSAVLVSSTATTITNVRENLGQIRSQGVEVAMNLRTGKAVSGSVGYQFADATVTQFSAQPSLVGKWIPDVPRESATGQVRAENARLGEVTLAARFGGRAFDDSSNIYPLAKFFEMDLSGQRRVGTRAEVFFLVENLTNVRQQVSRTPVLTLGSPIFAEGGVRFRLGRAGSTP
jgi:outer membrane receptor protein involved in Fe transport